MYYNLFVFISIILLKIIRYLIDKDKAVDIILIREDPKYTKFVNNGIEFITLIKVLGESEGLNKNERKLLIKVLIIALIYLIIFITFVPLNFYFL